MRIQTLLLLIGLLVNSIIQAQNDSIEVFFETNSALLKQNQIIKLNSKLQDCKVKEINVSAYCDSTGSVRLNLRLSENRANKIKLNLVELGVDSKKIQTFYYGENFQNVSKNLAKNRKAVVKFSCYNSHMEARENDISELYGKLKSSPQVFCINNNRDTIIQCEKGTVILIKANSFELSEKQIKNNSCIKLEVKEVISNSEIVLENLSTTSNGEILETMGMLYTNAMLGSDTLSLKKDLTIISQQEQEIEGAKIFDGSRNTTDGQINWELEENSILRSFTLKEIAYCINSTPLSDTCSSFNMGCLPAYDSYCRNKCLNRLIHNCQRCKFFNCRLKRIFKPIQGTFNDSIKELNIELRKCQKMYRYLDNLDRETMHLNYQVPINYIDLLNLFKIKYDVLPRNNVDSLSNTNPLNEKEKHKTEIEATIEAIRLSDNYTRSGTQLKSELIVDCNKIDSLMNFYKVTKREELKMILNKPLFDEFNVTSLAELREAMSKANIDSLEVAYQNRRISYEDFKFYIYNTNRLGWKNIDRFADIKEMDKTKIKVLQKPTPRTDCKLIYKERRFVLPPIIEENYFAFEGIPKNEKAWLVGLKYSDGIPFLSLEEITIEKNAEYKFNFKKQTLKELKEKLKVIDF